MAFTRTPSGLAEKWRFYKIPTIWVEGSTDIFFYEPITEKIPCRMEAFHGSDNSKALVQALVEHDYPYLVILDGDYKILKPSNSPHRCVLILPRYSFENFLWERESVIDPSKVSALVALVETKIDPAIVKTAQADVKRFLRARSITHLLKGHLLLGILKGVFTQAAAKESGTPAAISNDAFTQLLADMVWRRCQSDDHKRLKRAVRGKTRKLVSQYPLSMPNVR